MRKYKDLQIIKHALKYYVNRKDITEKQLKQELNLLKRVEQQVIDLKLNLNIPLSEYEKGLRIDRNK